MLERGRVCVRVGGVRVNMQAKGIVTSTFKDLYVKRGKS